MLNPDDIVSAWVTAFRDVPEIVQELGGNPGSIRGYVDAFPGPPEESFGGRPSLRRAIQAQEPGSILVVYMGYGPRRLNNAIYFQHRFSFVLRTRESDGQNSYGRLAWLMINGVRASGNSSLSLLHTQIVDGCEPMDLDLPSGQRQTMLISPDGETLDYFEMSAFLTEI